MIMKKDPVTEPDQLAWQPGQNRVSIMPDYVWALKSFRRALFQSSVRKGNRVCWPLEETEYRQGESHTHTPGTKPVHATWLHSS